MSRQKPRGRGYWAPMGGPDCDWIEWVEGTPPVMPQTAGWGASIPPWVKFYEKKP